MRPLKIGIYLETFEEAGASGLIASPTSWDALRSFARRVEALGFDSLWICDHLLWREDGAPAETRGVWECWSLLAALAADTRRIELGTLVLCAAFRNPALLAKMADTVEEISGGRLILGLGAGYHEPEFRAFGYPYDHLVSRFEEALSITTTLLRKGQVDFAGTYAHARDCELRPRGPRPGGPPILVAGGIPAGPRMLRLGCGINGAECENCGHEPYEGCCTADGRCAHRNTRKTCGAGGGICQVCRGSSKCIDGTCKSPSSILAPLQEAQKRAVTFDSAKHIPDPIAMHQEQMRQIARKSRKRRKQ